MFFVYQLIENRPQHGTSGDISSYRWVQTPPRTIYKQSIGGVCLQTLISPEASIFSLHKDFGSVEVAHVLKACLHQGTGVLFVFDRFGNVFLLHFPPVILENDV